MHGANRLASNSLLEGMVFAARVIEAIAAGKEQAEATGAMRSVLASGGGDIAGRTVTPYPPHIGENVTADNDKLRDILQRAMTSGAGVVRSAESLEGVDAVIDQVASAAGAATSPASLELRNLIVCARALVTVARARAETRGAHIRTDFPDTSAAFRCRLVLR